MTNLKLDVDKLSALSDTSRHHPILLPLPFSLSSNIGLVQLHNLPSWTAVTSHRDSVVSGIFLLLASSFPSHWPRFYYIAAKAGGGECITRGATRRAVKPGVVMRDMCSRDLVAAYINEHHVCSSWAFLAWYSDLMYVPQANPGPNDSCNFLSLPDRSPTRCVVSVSHPPPPSLAKDDTLTISFMRVNWALE